MGGRLDSTNVVAPIVSAITPIGYDHTGFLGEKLEGIAGEKAGILKHAVPAVIGRQREVSSKVIADEAAKLAAPLFRMGREWQVTATPGGFRYDSDFLGLDLPAPALVGAHQIDNAAAAVAVPAAALASGSPSGKPAPPPSATSSSAAAASDSAAAASKSTPTAPSA